METIEFLVKGSKSEIYNVGFFRENGEVTATCSCKAGRYSSHCKHRISILTNNTENIVSDNVGDVKIVSSWIKDTEIESALNYFLEMKKIEEDAKKEAQKAKKYFEKVMSKTLK